MAKSKTYNAPRAGIMDEQNIFTCINGNVVLIPKGKASEVSENLYAELMRADRAMDKRDQTRAELSKS